MCGSHAITPLPCLAVESVCPEPRLTSTVRLESWLASPLRPSSTGLCHAGSYCVRWNRAKALLRVAWPAFAGAVSVGLQGAGLVYLSGAPACAVRLPDQPELALAGHNGSIIRIMPFWSRCMR